MMRNANIAMTTTVNKIDLLATLRKNREGHKEIVQEARNGYIKKARLALEHRLEELRTGKLVALSFNLQTPLDYTEVYDNSIAMLEWNTRAEIELQADEFRQLVRDEWDWSSSFYATNSHYSVGAANKMK